MAEEVKKQVKQSATASRMQALRKRGRKKGGEPKTASERYLAAKEKLVNNLVKKDITGDALADMLDDNRDTENAKVIEKDTRLWLEILIAKGRERREAIRKGKLPSSEYNGVKIYEFENGTEIEVPMGFKLQPSILKARWDDIPVIQHREPIVRKKKN